MKKKRLLLRILVPAYMFAAAVIPAALHAQSKTGGNSSTDSLERILNAGGLSGSEKIRIYDDLCWTYLETDIGRAAELARAGLSMSKEMNEWQLAGKFCSHLGFSHYYSGVYDSAMICFEQMLDIAGRMKSENIAGAEETEADAYTNIGITYDVQGQLNNTVFHYLKALEIAERSGFKDICELLYANLGRAYYCLKISDRAMYYYEKDIELCTAMQDSSKIICALLGMGNIYLDRQEYGAALKYAETANRLAMEHSGSSVESRIFSFQELAEIHVKGRMDGDRALEYAQTALQHAEQWNSPVHIANSLRCVSLAYLYQKKYAAAEKAAMRALASDSTDMYANALLYEYIAKANIMTGNRDRAVAALDRQIALNSAYSDKNYRTSLSEMEVKYETEKRKIHILALEDEKRLMTWLVIAAVTILLSIITAIFFLWRITVQKKCIVEQRVSQLEQEKQLVATQAVLDGETHERTRLARDLHDGLGGMLTGIRLNLESARNGVILGEAGVACFENALRMLNESMFELRRLAHHLMPETLSSHGLKPAISDFCHSLSHGIVFDWFGSETRFDPKLEVVVYRIIHELVNNALKYSGASQILVQIMHEDSRIAFTVQDDGCGFDPSAVKQGMGLSNIRTRVASFGGNIQIDSQSGKGTEINVELPV